MLLVYVVALKKWLEAGQRRAEMLLERFPSDLPAPTVIVPAVESTDIEPAGGVDITEVQYRVLGPLTVLAEERQFKLGGPRQRMVLAVLLSHANRTVSQDALIDAVWAGEPPEAAKSTLQSYVSGLRRELGGASIDRQGDGYRVEVDEEGFDALRFENVLTRARRTMASDPRAAADELKEALAMWYGNPYGGLDNNPALATEVARLEELRLVAVESRIDADLAIGNHGDVVGELDSLVREYPLREHFRAQQMLALYRCGRQAEALRAFQQARTHLAEELGIDPSSELRDLEQRILDQDPSLRFEPEETTADAGAGFATAIAEGRTVRGYEIRESLGEGDFGVVHKAFQASVGREVAIKVIDPQYANRPDFVHRFEQEAQVVAQLEHPHIVALFDYWRDPDGAYLVMPHMRGGSLTTALRHGGWNLGPALALIEQIGGALAYAHRCGVIHGDLKPGNVLLDDEGNGYLTDFGIVVPPPNDVDSRVATVFVPPEELRGEPHTARSDIYSLGVLAFQVMTGIVPTGRLPLPGLTQARPGLPVALDEVLARATADNPARRFTRVEDFLRAFRQAVGADVVAVAEPSEPVTLEPVRNPYKGLRAFRETDALDFHGRDALIDELLEAVASHNLVAVVGPSGSGKSSLVRAGLIPSLRAGGIPGSRHWLTTDMFPGSYPFEELEAALLRVAVDRPSGLLTDLLDPHGLLRVSKQILPGDDTTLVLVIDQFEELFSAVASENTRRLFLDNLVNLANDERSRVRVVLTMRADFFNRPLEYGEFAEILGRGMVTVGPPSRDGLAQAIAAPARAVDVDLEPGLVARIVADVENQPGGLPLLQYALTELFAQRDDNTLTIDGYGATGGVLGALGQRAEELYREQSELGKEAVRQLFLRLVTVDESAADSRRRARRAELKTLGVDQEALDQAINQYGTFRLLSFDRDPVTRGPTIEVAHEALLREWGRLAAWIDDQRQELILSRRIGVSAQEWVESGADPSFLVRGGRLEQAEQWMSNTDIALSGDEVDYLAASRQQRDVEEADARRRRRWALVTLSSGLVIVAMLAAVAFAQRGVAEREAREARVRQLAGESHQAIEEDPELAILLALEAVDLTRSRGDPPLPEAIGALQRAVQSSRLEERLSRGARVVAASHHEDWFVTDRMDEGADGRARSTDVFIWGGEGEIRATLAGPGALVWDVAVAGDDSIVAVAYDTTGRPETQEVARPGDPTVVLFDPVTGAEVRRFDGPSGWSHTVALSDDGTRVAVAATAWRGAGTFVSIAVAVWDVETGRELARIPVSETFDIGFLPGGEELVAAVGEPEHPRVAFYSATTGVETRSIPLPMETVNAVPVMAVDPTGSRVVVASERAAIYDLVSLEWLVDLELDESEVVAWSPDGTLVAGSGFSGVITVADAETGSQVRRMAGSESVADLAFLRAGKRLVSVSPSGRSLIWSVTPAGPSALEVVVPHQSGMHHFHPSSDMSQLAILAGDGLELRDSISGEALASLSGEYREANGLLASPDFTLVGSFQTDGRSTIRRLPSLEVVSELERCTEPLAISPDNTLVMVSGYICFPDIQPPENSKVIAIDTGATLFEIPRRFHWRALFNPPGEFPAGHYLAVNASHTTEIYEVESGERIANIGAADLDVTSLLGISFDASSRYLAGGSLEGRAWVVDVSAVTSGSSMVDAVVFNQVVNTATTFNPAITPDGVIATGGLDSIVRLWDIHTGNLLVQWPGGGPPFHFSPDGTLLLYSDGDAIRKFYLDPERLMALAESIVTRRMTLDECQRYLDSGTCPAD